MANNESEPILSHDQVQRMIDERLELILEQEANDSGKNVNVHWTGGKSFLSRIGEFWKRMIKRNKNEIQ